MSEQSEEKYCGFVCADSIDAQQKIIDDIKDFSNYSPEFALVMYGKLIEMLYNARMELPQIKNK